MRMQREYQKVSSRHVAREARKESKATHALANRFEGPVGDGRQRLLAWLKEMRSTDPASSTAAFLSKHKGHVIRASQGLEHPAWAAPGAPAAPRPGPPFASAFAGADTLPRTGISFAHLLAGARGAGAGAGAGAGTGAGGAEAEAEEDAPFLPLEPKYAPMEALAPLEHLRAMTLQCQQLLQRTREPEVFQRLVAVWLQTLRDPAVVGACARAFIAEIDDPVRIVDDYGLTELAVKMEERYERMLNTLAHQVQIRLLFANSDRTIQASLLPESGSLTTLVWFPVVREYNIRINPSTKGRAPVPVLASELAFILRLEAKGAMSFSIRGLLPILPCLAQARADTQAILLKPMAVKTLQERAAAPKLDFGATRARTSLVDVRRRIQRDLQAIAHRASIPLLKTEREGLRETRLLHQLDALLCKTLTAYVGGNGPLRRVSLPLCTLRYRVWTITTVDVAAP